MSRGIYFPKIGDVVLDNGIPFVVADMVSYEDYGSCSYCRKYLLCEESFFRNHQGLLTDIELNEHGRWVRVEGISFPKIEKVKDIAPYEIEPVKCFSVRQRVTRTVTIYE